MWRAGIIIREVDPTVRGEAVVSRGISDSQINRIFIRV